MNPELKTEWVDALRSRKYKQGIGYLCRTEQGKPKWCCLGVLCDIMVRRGLLPTPTMRTDGDASFSQYSLGGYTSEVTLLCTVLDAAGFDDTEVDPRLADMNDGLGGAGRQYSFAEIADYIEREI